MKLTVGTYNLDEGGLDGGDESRLLNQLDLLAPLGLDLLGIQEAKRWDAGPKDDNDRLLNLAAARLGMSYRALVHSNHHGCHLAVFVRERSGLRVVREHHDQAVPWWHALAAVELAVDGWPRPLWFLNTHLAPASPTTRKAEAEAFDLFRGRDTILVGDFNAAAVDESPADGPGVHPAQARRKSDRAAAQAIEESGFLDLATVFGDPAPTVGHRHGPSYRADRIYSNLRRGAWKSYTVVQERDKPLSDHRPVIGVADLSTTGE
ncbi:endonuclease/exonuclease/phosphatase family protein [Spongiactinospora sp. TRM90649]|uniref:endonuclease/exonuclease/phosphatase family protein n=1 Tax=Spongiactinospora sp. TRM90649 TaxID=3031114 RepID=UPI0023F8BEED|nr:endonuclease/exonuclease/phosphatase family protein [Spongiactinospora sp. TRM90649]MDF5758411.1 hypothetical protein [Spongiactinospora sp. TRM90649]